MSNLSEEEFGGVVPEETKEIPSRYGSVSARDYVADAASSLMARAQKNVHKRGNSLETASLMYASAELWATIPGIPPENVEAIRRAARSVANCYGEREIKHGHWGEHRRYRVEALEKDKWIPVYWHRYAWSARRRARSVETNLVLPVRIIDTRG